MPYVLSTMQDQHRHSTIFEMSNEHVRIESRRIVIAIKHTPVIGHLVVHEFRKSFGMDDLVTRSSGFHERDPHPVGLGYDWQFMGTYWDAIKKRVMVLAMATSFRRGRIG